MKKTGFQVILRQRDKLVFKGAVESVTAFNEVGEFDVLKDHARMVTMIKDRIILRHRGGYKKSFEIKSGILSVEDNIVEVYLGV